MTMNKPANKRNLMPLLRRVLGIMLREYKPQFFQIVRRFVRPLPGSEYLDGGLLPLDGLGLCGGQPVNEVIDGGQTGVLVQIEVCLYNFDFQIRAAALPNKPIQAGRVRLDKHRFRSKAIPR